jgi:hypothetical protein
MSEIDLHEKLCLNFCSYYKPAKSDRLACMGFLVVERLIKQGMEVPFKKSYKMLDKATEENLAHNMCTACPFYKSDCDFIQQKENSLPCGGFILLGHLLEAHIVTIDNIKGMR